MCIMYMSICKNVSKCKLDRQSPCVYKMKRENFFNYISSVFGINDFYSKTIIITGMLK